MLKTLAAQIKQYKKSTILTPIFAALEVVMEVLIPMAMARLVKYGIEGGDTGAIYRYGFLMMAMAMLSRVFGSVCAHTASHASTGFAANLRDGMYRNIQRFSFANIDKYSTAGLVTRMTTDVTNVQNAFQMITRIAVRSPLTLIFSMIAAFVINPELAGVFLIPLVLLGVVLGLIIKRAAGRCAGADYHARDAPVRSGVQEVRRPARLRAGERLRHPRRQSVCARGLR